MNKNVECKSILSEETKEALFELALVLEDISKELIKEGKIKVVNGEIFDNESD